MCIVSVEFSDVEGAKQRTVKTDGHLLAPTKVHVSKLSFIQSYPHQQAFFSPSLVFGLRKEFFPHNSFSVVQNITKQSNSIGFNRAVCTWDLGLVRGDVLPETLYFPFPVTMHRAGDQMSADLGWIPDFITDLQRDLG